MPGPAGPSPKLIGRVLALVLTLAFAGVIWWAMSKGGNTQGNQQSAFPIDEDEIPGIDDIDQAENMVFTMADRDDPSRVAGIIEAERMEPMPGGERLLESPNAWIYPRSGGAIRIRSDRGRLLMPQANQAPESGLLEGSVRVLFYDTTPGPGIPPTDDATPSMTCDFDEPVRFERRYLRLTSPGRFEVETDRMAFEGFDLTIMLNEVRERIERLDVAGGGVMTLLPDEKPGAPIGTAPVVAASTPPVPGSATEVGETSAPTHMDVPATSPIETLYRTAFNDDVVITMGSGVVHADRLDLFTRVLDNQLPENAIADVGFQRIGAEVAETGSTPSTAPGNPMPVAEPAVGIIAASEEEPSFTLRWVGAMSLRPLDEAPVELTTDDVSLVLHAETGMPVRFDDPDRGLTALASSIRYHATRGVFGMDSSAELPVVELDATDLGSGRLASLEANLATGEIELSGPSTLNAIQDGDEAVVSFADSAMLQLAMNDAGQVVDRLRSVTVRGDVVGTRRSTDGQAALVEAEELSIAFDDGLGNPQAPTAGSIRRVSLVNGSIGNEDDKSDASQLSGEDIAIDFATLDAPDGARLVPIRVDASGDVRGQVASGGRFGQSSTQELTCDDLVATLALNDYGELFARTVDATGSVRYEDPSKATVAEGGSMSLDGSRETILLRGPDAQATQGDSTITGAEIALDARSRRMEVDGAGRFNHRLRNAGGIETGRVIARWDNSMRFDDALGRLVCEGETGEGVSVIATPDAYTRDTIKAGRIEIDLTPKPINDAIPALDGSARPARKRELLAARAYGGADGSGESPATVETRRYDPAQPERVIGLLNLAGNEILADARRNTLRVPGPGKLGVMDRDPTRTNESASTGALGSFGQGLSSFEWTGSMTLDRGTGRSVMDRDVSVKHKSIGDGQIATLDCDTLTVGFMEQTTEVASAGDTGSGFGSTQTFVLDSADAVGSVVFRANGRQLIADGCRFDAPADTLHALALPGRMVTIDDPQSAAPLSARAIRWDLTRDLIEINRPSPVTLPGN